MLIFLIHKAKNNLNKKLNIIITYLDQIFQIFEAICF